MWGDDGDTDLLRPSPAAVRPGPDPDPPEPAPRPSGRRDRSATGGRSGGGPRGGADRRGEAGGREPAGLREAGSRRVADGARSRPGGSSLASVPADRPKLGQRLVIGTVLVATLAAIAAGLLQPGSDPPPRPAAGRSQPQLPAPLAAGILRHPVVVALDPPPARPERCPTRPGLRCAPPAAVLTVDEVTAVRSEDRGTGALVRLSLSSWDAATLATAAGNGGRLLARVSTAAPTPATVGPNGSLVLAVEDRASAVNTVAALGFAAVPKVRQGKGALDRPLELWTVRASKGPCRASAAPGARGLIVVDRAGECLELRGPAVRLRTAADLKLVKPTAKAKYWVLSVVSADADRPALARFTRERAASRGRIAFVVGGRVVTGQPTVSGEASGGVELGLPDEAQGKLLLHRLRG